MRHVNTPKNYLSILLYAFFQHCKVERIFFSFLWVEDNGNNVKNIYFILITTVFLYK